MEFNQRESGDPGGNLTPREKSHLLQILYGPPQDANYVTELPWDKEQIKADQGHGYIFGFFTLDDDEPIDDPELEDEPVAESPKEEITETVEPKLICNGSITQPELIQHTHGLPHPVPMMTMGMQPQGMYVPVYSMYPPGIIRPSHAPHPGLMQAPMNVLATRHQTNIMVPPPPITQNNIPTNMDSLADSANKPRRNKKRRPPDYYEKAAKLEREQAQHVQRYAAPTGLLQPQSSHAQVLTNQNIIQAQNQRTCNTVPVTGVYNTTAVHSAALNGPYSQGQEYGIPGSAFHVYQGTPSHSCDTNIYQGQMNVNIPHADPNQVNVNQLPPQYMGGEHHNPLNDNNVQCNLPNIDSKIVDSDSPTVPSGNVSSASELSDSNHQSAAINPPTSKVPSTIEFVQTSPTTISSHPSKSDVGPKQDIMSKETESLEKNVHLDTAQKVDIQLKDDDTIDFTQPSEITAPLCDMKCDNDGDKVSNELQISSEPQQNISDVTDALNSVTIDSNKTELEMPVSKEESQSEVKVDAADSANKEEPVGNVSEIKHEQVAPAKKTWAGLFSGTTSTGISYNVSPQLASDAGFPKIGQETDITEEEAKKPLKVNLSRPVSAENDPAARQLAEFLLDYKLTHRPIALQPRGLTNRGNWCYINATLQALLACPPFYQLIRSIPAFDKNQRTASSTPVLDSMIQFASEFTPMPYKPGLRGAGKNVDLKPGPPFEPKNVYEMLQIIQFEAQFKHGRQEDAEEFLSCVLNCLHEEMLAALKLLSQDNKQVVADNNNKASETSSIDMEGTAIVKGTEMTAEDEDADSWEQVGPKNRSVITRSADFSRSPVSNIFCGQIRSVLHQTGSKESATLQPFFTLQLDIQSDNVWTVKDALEAYSSKESLQGYTSDTTKAQIEATRRVTLEELPPVLVLHLKCFVYDKTGGCQKILKKIDFSIDLSLGKEMLSPNVRGKYHPGQRMYKLFAVVNHYGDKAVGGHYNTDIYHSGAGGWIRTDDGLVKTIPIQSVLKFTSPKMPYLLYYRRCDCL